MVSWLRLIVVLLTSIVFLYGCTEKSVEPIVYGQDYCDHCKMQITDRRYGGALSTKQGRTLKFDSIECLAHSKAVLKDNVKEIYFVDFITSQLTPQGKIQLYKNINQHGPMGTHIQAHSEEVSLPKVNLEEIKP